MSVIAPSANNSVPSWPGLYNPGVEWLPLYEDTPVQEYGLYLYQSDDIFRFVLYWTLVFYIPIFCLCGAYAFMNLAWHPKNPYSPYSSPTHDSTSYYPLSPMPQTPKHSESHTMNTSLLRPSSVPKPPQKMNETRSRITFAFIVLFIFLAVGISDAFISSAIIGFTIAAVFETAGYYVSTWVPFLFALMHIIVGILSIYPWVIDII